MKALRVVFWVIQVILSVYYSEAYENIKKNAEISINDFVLQHHKPEPKLGPTYTINTKNGTRETFVVLKNRDLTITVIQDCCLPYAESDYRHYRKRDITAPNEVSGNGTIHQERMENYKTNCHTLYENILPVKTSMSTYCINEQQYTYLLISADQVNGDISKLLTCSIFDDDPTLRFTVEFELKVKAGRRVRVDLNGKELKFTETHLTRNDYDGDYWYRFVEGENITLQCSNIYPIGHVELQYYSPKDKLMHSIDERFAKPLIFHQMNAKDSESYVDCIYNQDFKEYPQTFVYRTIFLKDFFLLNVNDVNTTQMSQRIEYDEFVYIYKYVKGEQLKFTCEKTNIYLEGQIKIVYDDKTTRSAQEMSSPEWRKTVTLNTEDLDGGRVFCTLGKLNSYSIQFLEDSSRDNKTTVIVLCVLIPVVAIIVTLCVVYWCRRTRSTNSEQILNESFSQCSIPRFSRQMSNPDDCDYTYIENEYNYISESGYMRPNSLYRAKEGSAVPRVRLLAGSNQTDKNYPELYARYTAACNINTDNPTYPGSSKHEPAINIKKYENLHNAIKQEDEMNNVNYSYPQQKHISKNNKTFEKNNILDDINFRKEDNIIRYSNLLKNNNITQKENDK